MQIVCCDVIFFVFLHRKLTITFSWSVCVYMCECIYVCGCKCKCLACFDIEPPFVIRKKFEKIINQNKIQLILHGASYQYASWYVSHLPMVFTLVRSSDDNISRGVTSGAAYQYGSACIYPLRKVLSKSIAYLFFFSIFCILFFRLTILKRAVQIKTRGQRLNRANDHTTSCSPHSVTPLFSQFLPGRRCYIKL